MGKQTYVKSGGTWVDVTTGAAFPALASAPSSPVTGQVYWNTTLGKAYYYTGSTWSTINGADGAAATVSVGTTTTGSAGSSASVTNSGTSSAAVFNFTVPQGATGAQGPSGTTLIAQVTASSNYTLQASDTGKHISITTGGVVVPASVFSAGDNIMIYNNSAASQSITAPSVTLRLAGTASTGTRTLSQYGIATILCVASNTFVITGSGLS